MEQGDPFPAHLGKNEKLRYILVGTFLAGVVISNAFKSENVYKIVLPRAEISYNNIDELIEDSVIVYTRIQRYYYGRSSGTGTKCELDRLTHACEGSSFLLHSWSELFTLGGSSADMSTDSTKIRNYSRMHPEAKRAITAPLEFWTTWLRLALWMMLVLSWSPLEMVSMSVFVSFRKS